MSMDDDNTTEATANCNLLRELAEEAEKKYEEKHKIWMEARDITN